MIGRGGDFFIVRGSHPCLINWMGNCGRVGDSVMKSPPESFTGIAAFGRHEPKTAADARIARRGERHEGKEGVGIIHFAC